MAVILPPSNRGARVVYVRIAFGSSATWVTALPLVDYRGETPTTLIRKALETDRIHWGYTHLDPVIGWPRTIDEIMATTQDVTVADMPAVAVEYQARSPGRRRTNFVERHADGEQVALTRAQADQLAVHRLAARQRVLAVRVPSRQSKDAESLSG